MASPLSKGRDTVQCPYCDEYTGKPDSVRGHIRAKTDSQHKGKSGFEKSTEQVLEAGGEEPENQDQNLVGAAVKGIVTGILSAGFLALLWLAKKSGLEDEVEGMNRV